MPHPQRHEIYQAVISRMVTEGLQKKEEEFALAHFDDTDEQLLDYVRKCAGELGHSPHPKEIVGWSYLIERFGPWEKILQEANLPACQAPGRPTKFQLYQDEMELQKENYRKKKAEKQEKSLQRMKAQKEKQKQPV